MDDSTRAQFDLYFDLFAHKGWQLWMEDLEGSLDELDSVQTITTVEQLYERKGKLEMINTILNTQNMMEQALEQYDA